PCLMALRATRAFPSGVLGPVERSALRRLAAILRCENGRLRERGCSGFALAGEKIAGLADIASVLYAPPKGRGHNPQSFPHRGSKESGCPFGDKHARRSVLRPLAFDKLCKQPVESPVLSS